MIQATINLAVIILSFLLLNSCTFAEKVKADQKTQKKVYKFCDDYSNYYSSGKKSVSYKELREFTISATSALEVDGLKNGGISVVGENRSDIAIRACVRAWAETEEAAEAKAKNTQIETSGIIKAIDSSDSSRLSVSYKILVPNQIDLDLKAHNGGISIRSVNGTLRFKTLNGGISLKEVSGDVQGKTTNGGVSVKLSGNSWSGNGLDVVTTNGGVKLVLPRNYAANVETGTVNGGFKSDFAELKVDQSDKRRWHRPKRINASLNGGGAKIRVVTTNGGVKIASAEE